MQWRLAEIIRKHARERGDAPILTYGEHVITYAEMDELSNRVAQALIAEGVGPQERIAFIDKNGPEYFEVQFGASKANMINVAINWRLSPREMEYIINDSQARVLVAGSEFLPHLKEMEGSLATVRKVVVIGEQPSHETFASWTGRQPASDPEVPSAPDDVAMQLYTSGTTGLPKGAMLTNANFGTLVDQVSSQWELDPTSVNIVCMPLFHIGGSGWALVGMYRGCHSLLFRDFVPQQILPAIQEHRVTNALFVPAMLQFLTMLPEATKYDYSSLRNIVYGASPITNEILTRSMKVFGCKFIQVYGLTETTGAITQLDASDHDPEGPRSHLLRSAGKPYPWIDIRIVDPDSGEDRASGEVGELWVKSIQNMKGYWGNPEETAKTITSDGWLKTGDAGHRDAEGFIFLTDRVKDMIVSGGENIYPAEVENALSGHPDIEDIAVIGVPDERWGETVKAIVVKRSGGDPEPEDIIAYARERLAHFKCPTSVDFIEVIPRNPSGKILKKDLREPYWKGQERRVH